MDVIFHGLPARESGPFCAFSVIPMNAGIAVAASTTELGKALFSTMYTPGVFICAIRLLVLIVRHIINSFGYVLYSCPSQSAYLPEQSRRGIKVRACLRQRKAFQQYTPAGSVAAGGQLQPVGVPLVHRDSL